MERNRDARRGTVPAVNGGQSRRRQRNRGYRDSQEEDGGMEMQETGRLRDRGSKKDRDRDRSGRIKRRRGERNMHASNREEGEDSSEESLDEEEDDEEEDASVAVRLPPAPSPNLVPPSTFPQNNHRKIFPVAAMAAKVARPPVIWKAGDEMIGVSVPRRARSSSSKRLQEFSGSGVGGGEAIHRQASTSPSRPSPPSTTPISPSSSSASVRKKMKPISGTKQRPLKMCKSSSVSEDIEIEVAEVLYGLTRQFQPLPKPEIHRLDSKDANGSSNEARSRVSSPISISPAPPTSQPSLPPPNLSSNTALVSATAPKRKKPRPSSPASLLALPSTSGSSAAKMDLEQPAKTKAASPRSDKNKPSPAIENGCGQYDLGISKVSTLPVDVQKDLAKPEINLAADSKLLTGQPGGQSDCRDTKELFLLPKESPPADLDVNRCETTATATKDDNAANSSREMKYIIDLMAPPPGKSSPEREGLRDYAADDKAPDAGIEMEPKENSVKGGEEVGKTAKQEAEEITYVAGNAENPMPQGCELEKPIDLQIDLDKQNKDALGCGKEHAQKQQLKAPRIEPKLEKAAAQSVSLPLPMPMAGWPAGFPSFGYLGQVPSLQTVVPMDGSSGSTKALQPPSFLSSQLRPKRCTTHCYIAHNIHYHQQLARMTFWPAAAGAAPLYGSKQYNLNAVPPLESSILGNSLQGSFPGRNLGPMQDKGGPLVSAAYTGHSTKEKPSAGNTLMEASQRKQIMLQQAPPPGSATNMLQAPAFIFPINQQQAASAAARSGASKSTPGAAVGNAAPSSSLAAGSGSGNPATNMSFNYPGLPPSEAQYMAILQNSAYPFSIPTHVGAPPPYRGGSPAQAMPFFNGPFYSSHVLHPSQLQQQPSQQPSHTQQGHQNTSTSSGSSSSQKPPQQSQRAPGGVAAAAVGSSHIFPASKQQRQHLPPKCEAGFEDNPSNTDSRVSQAPKSSYSHNMAMAIHPQNFALLSPATAALGGGGGGGSHSEKQHQLQPQHQLTTSQAFAMSFASFGGAAVGAPHPGLDFSSMAQNHALFQSLPEAARHGYHQITAAAAAQTTQHKKPQQQTAEDGKSAGDSMNASVTGEEERKITAASKVPGSVPQHSLTFSRPNTGPPVSTVLGNNVIDSSSRTLNLIQAPANGTRVSNRPASAASATSGSVTTTAPTPNPQLLQQQQQQQQQQQHQQQLIQLQKQQHSNSQLLQQQQQQQLIQLQKQQQQQQQQQLQLQQQQLLNRTKPAAPNNSAPMYSDRLPAGPTMAKFPQALAGFPQALIQSSGSTTQSPQWKSSSTRAAIPAPAASTATSSVKNQHQQQQQQSRSQHQQQPLLTTSHQTQISFGKAAAPAMQQHLVGGSSSNPSLSSAAATAVGSPQSSASRSAGGSPRASPGVKPGQATVLPLQQQQQQQQQAGKSSPSRSTPKTSPMSNQNAPSILGHPHMTSAPNSGPKQQQQQQQQQLQKQPFPQAQFFFSNAYLPPQTSQPNGASAAGYYQRRQSELAPLQQVQQSSSPGSAQTRAGSPGMSDPAKAAAAAAAAGNIKGGIASPSLLPHPVQFTAAVQSASGAQHPLVSAAAYPYMHTMPPVSVKPAEQKPAAGNDNFHPCWQPDKR